MKFKRQVEIVKGRPDLTALVNVVLLLLFFFLLSSSFVQQAGIRIDLPPAMFVGPVPQKKLVVMLTSSNEVYFQNTKMGLVELRQKLDEEAKRSTEQHVVIQSDGRVPYETIVKVMDMAFQLRFRAVNLATRTELTVSPLEK